MKTRRVLVVLLISVAALLALSGCSTLAVTAPPGMFVSTGDYVPGVRTMGIVQQSTTVIAVLFFVDVNKVYQDLYERIIAEAQASGATGVTNIRFYWKPSPLSYLTMAVLSPVLDFYVEGVAIQAP